MILDIKRVPDPVLRAPTNEVPVASIGYSETQILIESMTETMHAHKGWGLAAPQIGQSLRIFVTSFGNADRVFINPVITRVGPNTEVDYEGCLSIPFSDQELQTPLRVPVKRHTQIWMNYCDTDGCLHHDYFSGKLARVIQHECDHLHGILITDKKEGIVLREKARASNEPGRNDPCPCDSGKKFKKCCMTL
jgi:peptide deformylase